MSMDYISERAELAFIIGGGDDFMSEDDALKLEDVLSIVNAACCIVGVAPSIATPVCDPAQFNLNVNDSNLNQLLPHGQTKIVVEAICHALATGKLETIRYERADVAGFGEVGYDLWKTLIDVDELKRWLLSRNCKPPFFFGNDASNIPDYLEIKHPSFSPEIAATIRVWEAIQDPELRKGGKTVKAAATEWLENNYRELGLIHNGERSKSAIDRIATLVNWEPSGGAPRTPG